MDEFVFKANALKLQNAKALKYVCYKKDNGADNEYVFFEHKGVVFPCFLSSMILAHNKSIEHQINYIDYSLLNLIGYIDMYLFTDLPIDNRKKEVLEFISTKILMDLNVINAIDKKANLNKYDYVSICQDLNFFFDSGEKPLEAYLNTLNKYNYSTFNILGIEYIIDSSL